MTDKPLPPWEDVLSAACRLQTILPDAVLVGGTSASSPFIAGLYARGGHTSQVIGPNTLYTAPKKDFIDVKLGQNAPPNACQNVPAPIQLCQSGTGWDGPTGLGSPNGLGAF